KNRKKEINAEFAEGAECAEKRTARKEEIGCSSIVRAHVSQKARNVGHPQVHLRGAFVDQREEGTESAGGDGVSDAGGMGEA
ncbi:MAG TPA: hypothetical protein VNH19_02340, partial [Candidatus Limnocylindrales bacterium]|nr:hypothetical protein [Candidatus Limnocylindrales bacterium]